MDSGQVLGRGVFPFILVSCIIEMLNHLLIRNKKLGNSKEYKIVYRTKEWHKMKQALQVKVYFSRLELSFKFPHFCEIVFFFFSHG